MTDKNAQLLEALTIALNLEKKGKEIFLNAANETSSDLARQTFEFLAKEEDRHIESIERFYQSIQETDLDSIEAIKDSTADERLESFNQRLEKISDSFKSTASDVEAYKVALEFEGGAEEFYEEKYNEATHPIVKKFYKWLIDEESMHSRLINSCLQFVEDPAEWFKKRNKV